MRARLAAGIAAFWICAGISPVWAGPTLSLGSNAPDLNNLSIGQTFRVDVIVSGITGGGLSNLSVDVALPSALLGTPSEPSAGTIVPDSTPPAFSSFSGSGFAGAIYDNIFTGSSAITGDGVFFSFLVTAKAPGSGSLAFDPPASAFNDLNEEVVVDSSAVLSFRVVQQAIPEPTAIASACVGLAAVACFRLILSRRAER